MYELSGEFFVGQFLVPNSVLRSLVSEDGF
jgi:hypothetical protein